MDQCSELPESENVQRRGLLFGATAGLSRLAGLLGVAAVTPVSAANEAKVPGVPSVLARSTRASYSDHRLSWNQSDKNGVFSALTHALS